MVSLLSGVQFLKEFGVFTFIMPFLLFFAVAYGFLSYVKPFGDDKYVNSVLAFIIAFMGIQFLPILIFVQYIIPYVFVLFLIIFFVWVLLKFMGVKEDSMQNLTGHPGFYGLIIVILLIGIFVFVSESFVELDKEKQITDPLGGVYIGDEIAPKGTEAITAETDDGKVTIITDEEEDTEVEDLLNTTIFHPTILAMIVMFIVFGVAAYMIVVVKED